MAGGNAHQNSVAGWRGLPSARLERAGALLSVSTEAGENRIVLGGAWTIAAVAALDPALRALEPPAGSELTVDLCDLDDLDTAGAWLIDRTVQTWQKTMTVVYRGMTEDRALLIQRVREGYTACEIAPPVRNPYLDVLERTGDAVVAGLREAGEMVGFTGQILAVFGSGLLRPWTFRLTSFVFHIEQTGFNALPIVALMSFLVGAVIAFLGADILKDFGAQSYTVDMLTFGFLREFGVLLAAVMVAGRSGSAFTAQIGTMRQREEVDAMRTLGLDPIAILVLPRVAALVVAMPLLTIVANFMGLLGGSLVTWGFLDITPGNFLARLYEVADLEQFMVGLVKAPIFAFVIAMIGCYQGLMVEGSAEAVGRRTTKAVVEAIFTVIVADAFFAVLFILIGI